MDSFSLFLNGSIDPISGNQIPTVRYSFTDKTALALRVALLITKNIQLQKIKSKLLIHQNFSLIFSTYFEVDQIKFFKRLLNNVFILVNIYEQTSCLTLLSNVQFCIKLYNSSIEYCCKILLK